MNTVTMKTSSSTLSIVSDDTTASNNTSEMAATGRRFDKQPFPVKLHVMLNDAERLRFDDVVGWIEGGEMFKVFQPKKFTSDILPNYFHQSKYKSFQRQLNLYSFSRVTRGQNKGAYIHPRFQRETPELCPLLPRTAVKRGLELEKKSQASRLLVGPSSSSYSPRTSFMTREEELELQIFAFDDDNNDSIKPLPFHHDSSMETGFQLVGGSGEDNQLLLDDVLDVLFHPSRTTTTSITATAPSTMMDWDHPKWSLPSDDRIADRVEQHSTPVVESKVSFLASLSQDEAQSFHSLKFPIKLFIMLEHLEEQHHQGLEKGIISWDEDGRSFQVHNESEFVDKIMPHYFCQSKFDSFRRQLHMYGFTRITKGAQKGVVSHPSFVKGRRDLCETIVRLKSSSIS